MGPSGSGYRDQGVQGGSLSGSPNRQSRSRGREEEGPGRDVVERAEDFSGRKRRGSPVYDEHTDSLGAQEQDKEMSLAYYGSCPTGSQALKAFTSGSKSERFMSPYDGYSDMDDSSFFVRTTRLHLVGPNSNSTRTVGRRSAAASPQKTERPRSQSPAVVINLPLAPTKLTSPAESYNKLSLQSSLRLADPTTSRKLLVLDLNGTLLLRSAHSGRRAPPPSYPRIRHSNSNTPSHPPKKTPLPALRTIYPRPYFPSFRAFLFHPSTLQWLDTMVWSSAQPHSVNDMVDKCFGTYQQELKAVWARDTLGLTDDEYYKKTQTTKDLAKPWAQILSSLTSNSQSPFSTSHPSDTSSEVEPNRDSHVPPPQQQQQQHSALTTLLMDDSPLKAVLQPWNHLCVSEYGAQRRKLDIEIAERNLERMWLAEQEHAKEMEAVPKEETTTSDGTINNMDMGMKSSEEADVDDKESERKRKRKEKKMLKKGRTVLAKEQQLEEEGKDEIGRRVEEESYDEMLLAVIGILDGLKHEGNVVGWMRSGGLIHVVGDQETILESNAVDGSALPPSENAQVETDATTTTPTGTTLTTPISSPPTTISPSKRDSSSTSMSIQGPSKRRRLTHVNNSSDTEMDLTSVTSEKVLKLGSDSETIMVPTTPTRTTKRSPSIYVPSSPLPSSSSPLSPAQVEQASTGVPFISTSAEPSTLASFSKQSLSTQSPPTQRQPLLWYEIPSVLSHWAQHGRRALAELGIDIVPGVVPPNENENLNGRNSSV